MTGQHSEWMPPLGPGRICPVGCLAFQCRLESSRSFGSRSNGSGKRQRERASVLLPSTVRCVKISQETKYDKTHVMRLVRFLLFFVGVSLAAQWTLAEDRLGVQVISDGIFTRTERPNGSYPASDVRFNGQAALLASFRFTPSLFAFYEGRISHVEGLNHHDPPLSQTMTAGVLQGYLRYSTRLPTGLNLQAGKFGNPFGQFLTRNYADQNPLIGFPLMYTHRTTVRANQLPSSSYDLLRWQARTQPLPGYSTSGDSGSGW